MQPDNQERESKYWIKRGIPVEHKNYPGLIMYVDRVEKSQVEETPGQNKTYTIGVHCHWLSKDHKYQKGMFHTGELAKPLNVNLNNEGARRA